MKYLITKCTLFLLAFLVSSCAQDELTQIRPSANEAVLSFTLPNRSNVDVGAQTKTAKNDFEKTIYNMNIYIVEATAGESTPADDAAVLEHYNTYSNTDSEISVKILSREEPCFVVALVNMSDNTFAPTTYADIKDLSQGLRSLYVTPGGEYASGLPMFGQEYFSSIETSNYDFNLAHICARIDVVSEADNFTLESVTLMNGANKGHFVPQSPMAEYTGTDVMQYQTVEMSSEETTLRPIYLFENSGGTSASKNYTDIILGGKYTISAGNEELSFIKIKMEHSDPLSADIIRNTLYKLTLLSINKSNIGYTSVEDAQKGEYSNVKIKIDVDLDAFTDLVVGNGDYYMSLSNSEYRAFIPSGAKTGLTAVTVRFNKNSTSTVDMTNVKKEISLGAYSQGITIVGGEGNKTSTWTANQDIDIKVDLADYAHGSLIVRIGNLVKEVHIEREQSDANFATAFNDDNYVYALFTDDAPAWLKISTKNGIPSVTNELYSEDGFKLGFSTERDGSQSAELYLSRSSAKGRTKVYVDQYKATGTTDFSVSGLTDNTDINYKGETLNNSFSVISINDTYTTFLDGNTATGDPSWIAEFSTDGGTTWDAEKPEWLTMPISGDGSVDGYTIQASAQKFHPIKSPLLDAEPKGSESLPYDLSTNGGTSSQNTANCYMVDASGTYKIPMIYGNAMKDGDKNPAAYAVSGFVKHDGAPFSKPEIDGADNAILCWQDANGLITDVKIEDNHLVFTVPRETIIEGNAVIAVRASNLILWSWHIWVTSYTSAYDKTVYYHTSQPLPLGQSERISKMMSLNLGWCDPILKIYGESTRSVKVRLKQAGGSILPSVDGITFTQEQGLETYEANNPYYQYGRKDPMLPSNGSVDKDKEHFGYLKWKTEAGSTTLVNAIQNPNVFYIGSNNWCSTTYNNLWSANNNIPNTAHIVNHVKTVYDPSPVGYVVPPCSYFTGFTTTGDNSSSLEVFNVKNPWKNGWDFYCELNKTGSSTIYIPATGYRNLSYGKLTNVNTHGYIWSASPNSNTNAYSLSFHSGDVSPSNNYSRAPSFPIRPVQE